MLFDCSSIDPTTAGRTPDEVFPFFAVHPRKRQLA